MNNLSKRDDYFDVIMSIINAENVNAYLTELYKEHSSIHAQIERVLIEDIQSITRGIDLQDEDFHPMKQLRWALTCVGIRRFEKKQHYRVDDLIEKKTPEYEKKLAELKEMFKKAAEAAASKPPKEKKKSRVKIPKENKIRAELQKEINSRCPFCGNGDAGHFEIHHIDNDPGNNEMINLILVCPTCHSKITKGDISSEDVKRKKATPVAWTPDIEFVSATIDNENCSWYAKDELIFYDQVSKKSSFPIIGVTFINHTENTVVLKAISVKTTHLFSGFMGPPHASVLKSLIKYRICINENGEGGRLLLSDPLQVPSKHGVKFDMELYEKVLTNETGYPEGRIVLKFRLEFSGGLIHDMPAIYLNTMDESDSINICGLD